MKNYPRFITLSLLFTFLIITLGFAGIRFTGHTIEKNGDRYPGVYPVDMDGDGDLDVVGCIWGSGEVLWWRNDGHQNFTRFVISSSFAAAHWVHAADVDGDHDIDVLGAAYQSGEIAWWENNGHENFTFHQVGVGFTGATSVYADDVDGDGDLDILGAAEGADDIRWWENNGHEVFTQHSLANGNFNGASHVYSTDLDDDGDVDILGAARFGNEIACWENDGNQNFTKLTIAENFHTAMSVWAIDIDGDQDLDVLGGSYGGNKITWWENRGELNFTEHPVADFAGVRTIYAADLDADGDMDVVGASARADIIAWWENDGNQNFFRHTVSTGFTGAHTVYAIDLDKDGDCDLLGSAWSEKGIAWWESELFSAHFEATPKTGHAPLKVNFFDSSNAAQAITAWAWDFNNDGIIDSEEQNPTWTYEEPGVYTIRLEVSNDSITYTKIQENLIHTFSGKSALFFNGKDSYTLCPASPSLNLTNALTLEAWINPAEWGELAAFGLGRIFEKNSFSLYLLENAPLYKNHSLFFRLMHADGAISRSFTPENSIVLDEWQHVAVTFDGDTLVKMFVNGREQVLTQTKPPSGTIIDNSEDSLYIGNTPDQRYTFNGTIDEVRIWNAVRQPEEIMANMNTYLNGDEAGLVGYWQMDEGRLHIVKDKTTFSNHGIIVDAEWREGVPLNPLTVPAKTGASELIPHQPVLHPNYPNPFNPNTTIQFELPAPSRIILAIYNMSGQLVKTLADDRLAAGHHSVNWNGTDGFKRRVSSGVYFCRISNTGFSEMRKMLLLK